MSSNSRMTRSKGPAEELSLPPTRMRKDVSTANEGEENAQGQVQANVQSQQRTVDMPSPFARPGSRAGTCITPTSDGEMLPKASNPFTRPDSRAGFAPSKPTSPQSSVSSTSDNQLQEDVNTSVSWDLVDTDTDAEVANINTRQNNAVDLNNAINTVYNQDFFVADTTGRRLSQVTDKSNYSSLLPNGNAALQLRLPDLLIYLKTDTYLVDVKTGHHYAVYHNRIEKMSVLPKLYSAWPYRQLLQAIHDDAVRFGVNSPEPATSEQSAPVAQPSSSVDRDVQAAKKQQPSPCMPTIVNYEPPNSQEDVHEIRTGPSSAKPYDSHQHYLQQSGCIRRPDATGTSQRCSLQGGTTHPEKSTYTGRRQTPAHARGRQRIQTNSRTTPVRPARTFVDGEKHGHGPRPRTTLHGNIFRN